MMANKYRNSLWKFYTPINNTINRGAMHAKCASSANLVRLVLKSYMPDLWSVHRLEVDQFLGFMLHVVKTRGLTFGLTTIKGYRLCVLRTISGSPLGDFPGIPLQDGWPIRLAPFKTLIESPEGIRFLLTILWIFRGIKIPPTLDFQSIVQPSKADCFLGDQDFALICRWLGIKRKKEVSWNAFHMTAKRGPNGPALLSAMIDLIALTPKQVTSIDVLGGPSLSGVMADAFANVIPSVVEGGPDGPWGSILAPKAKGLTRKLAVFPDKEGKTRVVALGDYWAQTALKPYHKELSNILRKLPNDCTYDQGLFLDYLKDFKHFDSLDLSNATDRMPLALQERIFARIFGEAKSKAWADLLVGEPYMFKGVPYAYAAGQPMGMYSSWASMALTHHFIVKWAGLRAGLRDTKCYVILGDDVVIADHAVAREYRYLLGKLDMPWNESKTHSSSKLYEFAKRWIYEGHEVTPFSISGLFDSWKSYSSLTNFFENQRSHGWSLSSDSEQALIINLHRYFVPRHKFVKNKVLSQIRLMEASGLLHEVLKKEEFTPLVTSLRRNRTPASLLDPLGALKVPSLTEPESRRCRDLDELEDTARRLLKHTLEGIVQNDGKKAYRDSLDSPLAQGNTQPRVKYFHPLGYLLREALGAALNASMNPKVDTPPSAMPYLLGHRVRSLDRVGSTDPRSVKCFLKTLCLWEQAGYPWISPELPPPWVEKGSNEYFDFFSRDLVPKNAFRIRLQMKNIQGKSGPKRFRRSRKR